MHDSELTIFTVDDLLLTVFFGFCKMPEAALALVLCKSFCTRFVQIKEGDWCAVMRQPKLHGVVANGRKPEKSLLIRYLKSPKHMVDSMPLWCSSILFHKGFLKNCSWLQSSMLFLICQHF